MCIHPQQEVGQLDTSHLNYSTIECREAHLIVLQYDPKNAERLGIGLLLGFLGPVGLVMAVATDAERYQKGEAIVNALKLQCVGEPRASSGEENNPLSARLTILKDLLTKELIPEDEYNQFRARALEE